MDLAELQTLAPHGEEYDKLVNALASHHGAVESVMESSVIKTGIMAGLAAHQPVIAGLAAASNAVRDITQVVRGHQLVQAMDIHVKRDKYELDYKRDLVKLKVEDNQSERKERLEDKRMQYADAADKRRADNEKYKAELGGLEQERQAKLEEKRIEAAKESKLFSASIEQAKDGTLRMICEDRKDARQNEVEMKKLELEKMKLNLQQGHQAPH